MTSTSVTREIIPAFETIGKRRKLMGYDLLMNGTFVGQFGSYHEAELEADIIAWNLECSDQAAPSTPPQVVWHCGTCGTDDLARQSADFPEYCVDCVTAAQKEIAALESASAVWWLQPEEEQEVRIALRMRTGTDALVICNGQPLCIANAADAERWAKQLH